MTHLYSREARRIRKPLIAATTPLRSQEARRIRKPLIAATTPLHPGSCILIYLLIALAIPGMPFFMLPVPLLPALILLILRRSAPLRLVWRTRWLMLVLLLGYAYSLPGEPLWQALGTFSPSREGGVHGIEQAMRLLILLLWLDILVLGQPAEKLLAGLYQLLRPISWIGVDPKPAALRLGLTLRAIEGMERGRGNLNALFKLDFQVDLPQKLELSLQPLRPFDVALPSLAVVGLILTWLA
jgi:hypothetical protein